jgi:Protein of unknown function (DUF2591)
LPPGGRSIVPSAAAVTRRSRAGEAARQPSGQLHHPFSLRAVPVDLGSFSPSTDWLQGGLIIERWPGIYLFPLLEPQGWFQAEIWPEPQKLAARSIAPTPLIAAMRALVASKFGDEVPDVV